MHETFFRSRIPSCPLLLYQLLFFFRFCLPVYFKATQRIRRFLEKKREKSNKKTTTQNKKRGIGLKQAQTQILRKLEPLEMQWCLYSHELNLRFFSQFVFLNSFKSIFSHVPRIFSPNGLHSNFGLFFTSHGHIAAVFICC